MRPLLLLVILPALVYAQTTPIRLDPVNVIPPAMNADGSTVLFGAAFAPDGTPDNATNLYSFTAGVARRLTNFTGVSSFSGITRLGSSPLYLIGNPSVPAKTVKEVIELAKAQPGKLNFSSPGLASTTFIAGALFRKAAGVNMIHVPFRSAPDAVTAVIRGDVQFYFAPVNLAKEQSEGGKVTAIAAATAKRIPDLPNVPTFTEAGLPFVFGGGVSLAFCGRAEADARGE